MFFITFDEYYGVEQYNSFINSAKNNDVEYTEWVNIRPPYNWYLRVDSKDIPKFVDFDTATSSQERFMVKKTDPLKPSDEYYLMRREGNGTTNLNKFLRNDMWDYISEKQNFILFRGRSVEQLMSISRNPEMKDTKIFILGTYRGWKLAVTDNKFIEGFLEMNQILHTEYDSKRLVNESYELEAYINYYILRTDKISKKNLETTYVMNGAYFPVKATGKYTID